MGTCEACGGIIGYEGYGTALKPAYEPVWLARKPLIGTVAENVTQYGTGALNIDGCRVTPTGEVLAGGKQSGSNGSFEAFARPWQRDPGAVMRSSERSAIAQQKAEQLGRWPANLIHDGSEEVLAGFPATGASKAGGVSSRGNESTWSPSKGMNTPGRSVPRAGHDDNGGSAARFFYCAKADKADRDDGCASLPVRRCGDGRASGLSSGMPEKALAAARNHHPTVKPTDLMRYLCRLITPPGGIVLDPFTGSGSTGRGAVIEGFSFIGIEREADYCEIARKRIAAAAAQGNLFHEVVA